MTQKGTYQKLLQTISIAAEPLTNYQSLLNKIGDARFVLMGEATHGTHEFYQARAEISKQLILQKGFMAIAIEGDWPDTYRIHRYINGTGDKEETSSALSGFKRFPLWMWRNKTLLPFLKWLREHNDNLKKSANIGFYGLDLYSLYGSIEGVLNYLAKVDPEAAKMARLRYACFDEAKLDPQSYGYLTTQGIKKACVKESVDQLLDMQQHAMDYIKKDELDSKSEYFYAVQNARLVKNAEIYYRSLFESRVSSWNIRDRHMSETLNLIADHLENLYNKPAKIIVWAHNSHVGDARATEMGDQDEVNLGQLTRELHEDTYLLGFSTYQGSVTAASHWGNPAELKIVQPGLAGSYEDLFHQMPHKNFLLDLHANEDLHHYLDLPRLQRAIGVVYRPDTERHSHYFFTRLPFQFDSIIHFDQTHAVEPLDRETVVEESSTDQN